MDVREKESKDSEIESFSHEFELYATGKKSMKQAARIAGMSLAEWFEIAKERRLLVQISPDEIEDEIKALTIK
jgi:predicted HTH domain antitoxin